MMSAPPSEYSSTPMSRFQFLMLRAVEGGASVTEAADEALAWRAFGTRTTTSSNRVPDSAWEATRHDEGDDSGSIEAD